MPFFPYSTFGWVAYGILLVFMLALVVTDLRSQRLPNAITLTMLSAGLAMNMCRGAGIALIGEAGSGALNGLLFGIFGVVVAFILFVALWQLGKCGAGDVKLMAAVGAWVGYLHFFFVFASTIVAVLLIMLIWWSYAFATRRNPGLKLSYALPCFISLSIVMPWLWRRDLW